MPKLSAEDLRLIMQNIISNGGNFNPLQLPGVVR